MTPREPAFADDPRRSAPVDRFDAADLPAPWPPAYLETKRVLDIVGVLALLPLALPIAALASVAILVTMGRPILFTQPRLGRQGRPFTIVKLRTMRLHQPGGVIATSTADSRITPLGRILRRFRVDELPQLWNVLAGDMSLIGPRPEQPALAEAYERDLPSFALRRLLRPGITGWAQVNAGYAADLAETRVKLGYDLFYLKHVSFGLDLRIGVRTLVTLLTGAGAR